MSDLADGLGAQGQSFRHPRGGSAPGQMAESQGARDDTHLLNAGAQQFLDANEILGLNRDGEWTARHTP